MFGDIGWQELVLTLAILALVFGAGRVADIGGALGKGIREFRNEVKGEETTTTTPAKVQAPAASTPAAAPEQPAAQAAAPQAASPQDGTAE
jgi:sec-independent protein translocase protein TatA